MTNERNKVRTENTDMTMRVIKSERLWNDDNEKKNGARERRMIIARTASRATHRGAKLQ